MRSWFIEKPRTANCKWPALRPAEIRAVRDLERKRSETPGCFWRKGENKNEKKPCKGHIKRIKEPSIRTIKVQKRHWNCPINAARKPRFEK